MKFFSLLIITISLTANSNAAVITPLENIKYDCAFDPYSGGVAINIEDQRAWITDSSTAGKHHGYELKMIDFSIKNCPTCISITGELHMLGTIIDYKITLNSIDTNGSVSAYTRISASGIGTSITYPCTVK